MARSNNSFIKKLKADKRAKLRKEKLQKRVEKTKNSSSSNLDSMIAYVDKFGNITSEPPDDKDIKIDNSNIQLKN
jgi:hypothetical protein